MTKQRIHIIGICGVGTSALASALHEQGHIVTGSDKGFFPPVSTQLDKLGISYYAGWHPEKMVEHGTPDLVIAGGSGTSLSNPEVVYTKEHAIPLYSFAEAFGKFFVHENSIVTVGTWGKTSSAALLSFILSRAAYNPTYFFGGISLSHERSAHLTDSAWSILEGDEYQAAIWDKRPKFAYYKPTHLLLSAISWDHADLYPTEASYFDAFTTLIQNVRDANGLIAVCADNSQAVTMTKDFPRLVTYGNAAIAPSAAYTYSAVSQSVSGLKFTISHSGTDYTLTSPLIGEFQAENITGCFALAHSIGIAPDKIIEAISLFKGLKRRLEKRVDGTSAASGITIIDDIAHSPEKASSVLANLRKIYTGKIYAVFEPNIGGRKPDARSKYMHAFKDADEVIIPRLSKLKVAAATTADDMRTDDETFDGHALANTIGESHPNTRYIEHDDALIAHLKESATSGDVIAFLGSHGFRGMIEEVVAAFA